MLINLKIMSMESKKNIFELKKENKQSNSNSEK